MPTSAAFMLNSIAFMLTSTVYTLTLLAAALVKLLLWPISGFGTH